MLISLMPLPAACVQGAGECYYFIIKLTFLQSFSSVFKYLSIYQIPQTVVLL